MKRRNTSYSITKGGILASLLLTIFIFSAAVVITLNFRILYYLDITLLNLPDASGMSVADIRSNYDALISYNQVWHQSALQFPTLGMSQEGAIHFREVKRIFDGIQIAALITGILSLVLGITQSLRHGKRWMRITAWLCLVIPAAFGIMAAVNWNGLFTGFHRLFFRNDYWLFDPETDPVIEILPDTYFLQCACMIIALIMISSLICFLLSKRRRNIR